MTKFYSIISLKRTQFIKLHNVQLQELKIYPYPSSEMPKNLMAVTVFTTVYNLITKVVFYIMANGTTKSQKRDSEL